MMENLPKNTNESSPQTPQTTVFSPESAIIAEQNRKNRVKTLLFLLGVCCLELGLTFSFKLVVAIKIIPVRIMTIYLLYGIMICIVAVACFLEKRHIKTLGFSRERLPLQILTGAVIAVGLAFFIGALPILLGGPEASMIGGKLPNAFEAVYQIFTCLVFIGTVEELLFRGYIQTQLGELIGGKFARIASVLIAAALFGLWHIVNGSWIQVAFTFGIGCVFGFCRAYLKNCTLLSVIVAHGLYDALLIVIRLIFF